MGFTIETGVSAAVVFVQGLLSFSHPAYCRWFRCIWDICQAGSVPGQARRIADRIQDL